MNEISYLRPTKILWLLPHSKAGEHWSSVIPSRSVRELVKKNAEILEASQIESSVLPLTEDLYSEWHTFYSKKMIEQKHDVIASPQWFQQKKDLYSKTYLIDFRSEVTNERLGASIIAEDQQKVFTHVFKASDRVDITGPSNVSLGILIEIFFLEFAYANGASQVSAGLSRNGFGYFNTIGYLASKLRMGYIPIGAQDRPWENELPRHSQVTPTAWFVKGEQEDLTLLLFPSLSSFPQEIITYLNRLGITYKEYGSNN